MKRPDKPVEIRTENAKNYPVDPDSDYRVSDIQKHLKLRILRSGSRKSEYDYLHKGTRRKHTMGSLDDLTPTQARALVMGWETNRKKGLAPFTKAAKGISLLTEVDAYFNHRRIKPHTSKTGVKTGISPEDIAIKAPIQVPNKILAVGLNYKKHVEEAKDLKDHHSNEVELQEQFPNIFNKQNSSVNDPYGEVHRPNASNWLDYEGELGMVVGKSCRHVPYDQAHKAIYGYTVVNDFTVSVALEDLIIT